jgi:protein-S-isoprenylcysteine O-methyltransferase Ste14
VTALDFFARWRVRLGYLLAIVSLILARPTLRSMATGALIGLVGLGVRAYAAGYLHKQEVLTVTGPYARTRNPLYFGSSMLTVGASVAMNSWWVAGLLFVYFALVYSMVMRREEMELRRQHGAAFDQYAESVPLFFPRLIGGASASAARGGFSWKQYTKNHEYQALFGFLLLLIGLLLIWRLHA